MDFKPLATFELNEEVARTFLLKNEGFPKPEHDFPFSEFAIIFPSVSFSSSREEAELSIINSIDRLQIKNPKAYIKQMLNQRVIAYFKMNRADECCSIALFLEDKEAGTLTIYNDGRRKVSCKYAESESELNGLFFKVLLVLQGVVWHYLSPVTVKKINEVRERKADSPLKTYNSPSKKYIYRTKYIFENATRDITEETRTYARKTDSWMVSGHVRRYRDSQGNVTKEIFIKPYQKGCGKIERTDYKITRI